jgi:hypothetical protein
MKRRHHRWALALAVRGGRLALRRIRLRDFGLGGLPLSVAAAALLMIGGCAESTGDTTVDAGSGGTTTSTGGHVGAGGGAAAGTGGAGGSGGAAGNGGGPGTGARPPVKGERPGERRALGAWAGEAAA